MSDNQRILEVGPNATGGSGGSFKLIVVPPGYHSIIYRQGGGIMAPHEGGVVRGLVHLGSDANPNYPLCGATRQNDNEHGDCPECWRLVDAPVEGKDG